MKNLFLALLGITFAGSAYAQTYTGENYRKHNQWVVGGELDVVSGGEVDIQSGATLNIDGTLAVDGAVDTSAAAFDTALTANPLVQMTYKGFTVSTDISSTAPSVILASVAGKSIYPTAGLSIMVSGNAAGATSMAVVCSGGRVIASWPVGNLIDQKPIGVGLYLSTQGTITTGAGLTQGCPVGEAVMISNIGTAKLSTTTHLYVSIPYVVQ